jgi:hypothetical protein
MSELSRLVYSRLRPKVVAESEWADIVSAVQGMTAAQKAQIVRAAQRGDFEAVGKRIVVAFTSVLEARIATEANAILADGSLSAAEIERLLG